MRLVQDSSWRRIDGTINQEMLADFNDLVGRITLDFDDDYDPVDVIEYLRGHLETNVEAAMETLANASDEVPQSGGHGMESKEVDEGKPDKKSADKSPKKDAPKKDVNAEHADD
jgi:hypothetical protein